VKQIKQHGNHSKCHYQLLGYHKEENYCDMLADLVQSYKAMGVMCLSRCISKNLT